MTEKAKQILQMLGKALVLNIKGDFARAWARAEMQDGVSQVGVYFVRRDGRVFSTERSDSLDELFYKLWESFRDSNEAWTSATYVLESDGKFDLQISYDNIFNSGSTAHGRTDRWRKDHFGEKKIHFL